MSDTELYAALKHFFGFSKFKGLQEPVVKSILDKNNTFVIMPTGGGKSLLKCHMAANHLMYGKNVLYITMEMAAEEIGRRIDANIMDITLDEVAEVPRDVFEKRMARYKTKTTWY